MKLTTSTAEQKKLENASLKAKRLCKLYKTDLIGLIVLSIDTQAQNKINNKGE